MEAVIVTGATSGIGLGCVHEILSRTNRLVIAVARHEPDDDWYDANGIDRNRFQFMQCDVSNPADCKRLSNTLISESRRIVGLVHAAGTISSGGIRDETVEGWSSVIAINLTGAFLVTKAIEPHFSDGASIVNISSVCSLRPCSSVAYSASKAGLDMFTKCLAKELSDRRIRVNAVNPGVVRSNLQLSAGVVDDYAEFLDRMAPLHPLGRVGEPQDIAHLVLFLLSDDSSWITGAIISADGGRAL